MLRVKQVVISIQSFIDVEFLSELLKLVRAQDEIPCLESE